MNRSGLCVRNGFLVYKQLIRIWRSDARTHVKKLHVFFQSKCLYIAISASLYTGKTNSLAFGVLFFAEHIRCVAERFDSKLAELWNPFFLRQFGIYIR